MKNDAWVKNQFELFRKHKQRGPRYRDVLVVTSFIETVIRDRASRSKCKKTKGFKGSLEDLGLNIDRSDEKKSRYQLNCQYKKDYLEEINVVRVQRNELLHDIIGKELPEKYIGSTIKDMTKNIELICTKSNLIRNYFINNYGFDPAVLI